MGDHITREIRKRAAEAYDLAVETGERFDCDALVDDLVVELLTDIEDDGSIFADLVTGAARSAIDSIDKSRRIYPPQAALFESMDQPVAVGGGKRIARRAMEMVDWTEHLSHVGDNVSRVNAAASKENARFSALAKYLGLGMDTEAAVAAWQEANPEQVLP